MNQEDFDTLCGLERIRIEVATQCVKILNRLFEELPLERCAREAVAAGEVGPEILDELFGSGEGSGWSGARDLTIETALGGWYKLEEVIVDHIKSHREER